MEVHFFQLTTAFNNANKVVKVHALTTFQMDLSDAGVPQKATGNVIGN